MARRIYEPEIPGTYGIINQRTGWLYVGKGARIGRRWDSHLNMLRGNYHFNTHLQSSWLKHGEAAFTFEVLLDLTDEMVDLSDNEKKQRLRLAEAETMKKYPGRLYNKTMGGDGGVVPTPETVLKMAAAQQRRYQDPEERVKSGARFKAFFDKDNGAYRKQMSKLTTQRNIERWADPKNHVKHSAKLKEALSSPEYKERQSAIITASWKDETVKQARLKGIRDAWNDPVRRAARLEKKKLTTELNKRNKERDRNQDDI